MCLDLITQPLILDAEDGSGQPTSPAPASSGRANRHDLSRGGDRAANAARYRIALVRMAGDFRTREYAARRTAAGWTKKEIVRLLKRAIIREMLLRCLTTTVTVPLRTCGPHGSPRTSRSPPPTVTSDSGRPPSPTLNAGFADLFNRFTGMLYFCLQHHQPYDEAKAFPSQPRTALPAQAA
ncbi:hypothetical protein [Streptomyces sp. NPDC058451]|uniref:hypothetical protein n=1 Tax=Streptomyces sp. NPDC058451 TaxID=3346506 RepID=UPI0036593BD7